MGTCKEHLCFYISHAVSGGAADRFAHSAWPGWKHNMGPRKAASGAQGPEMDRGPPERDHCELNGPKVVPKTVPERHERNMLDRNSVFREVSCTILTFFEAK